MKRYGRYVLAVFITLLTLSFVHAQEATETPDAWPIEQRCIGALAKPPKDWTFPGAILLTSDGKLHAYQQGWSTPRILVFNNEIYPFGIGSAILSPNQRWYALVESTRTDYYNIWEVRTKAIHIYSTASSKHYIVKWETAWGGSVGGLSGHVLYWIDNEHLLYSKGDSTDEKWFVINPFSGEVTDWQASFNPSWDNFSLSPDAQKALYKYGMDINWTLFNGNQELQVRLGQPSWRPDSQAFVGYTAPPDSLDVNRIVLLDLQGQITEIIMNLPERMEMGLDGVWSPDGRYFAFATNHLYIADMANRRLIDTCYSSERPLFMSAAWSPDSSQLAFISYADRGKLQVLDLKIWERYVVAYHYGDVIGWRE